MKLSLGFSPCPNDTFLFYGLVHQKVDTEGLDFEIFMDDVAALNQMAFHNKLDITKLSYHAYTKAIGDYVLLDSGSALGNNCGPLLIAKKALDRKAILNGPIAIPGQHTTANFLLSLAYPSAQNRREMLFSDIEEAVLNEEVAAGLIIHENRFTYQDKGLVKIIDLGEYWETKTQMPIPLGGICIKRSLPLDIQQRVNRAIRRSVQYAFKNPDLTTSYVSQYAQEMSEEVMFKHIRLYVNNYTEDLGKQGKKAITTLFDIAQEKGIVPKINQELFLPSPSS